MRALRYGIGLIAVASLFVIASPSRGDILITITDGTTTKTGLDSIPNFTLDGVSFRGVSAFEVSGPDSLNFSASLSGKENGATITYTVVDTTAGGLLTGPYSSFTTTTGLTQGVKGGTVTAQSTVNTTVGPSVTIPYSLSSAESITSASKAIPAPGTITTITLSGTITGFHMNTAPPSFSASTKLVVPEPNGVLIGLLGLPCMAAVVYFSRRRASAMALAA
jgi:hypothetical protein